MCHRLLIPALLVSSTALAQVQFTEVGGSRGIGPYTMAFGMGGGVAAADFDDDGDIDLFVPNGSGVADQLYRNDGAARFTELAVFSGVASRRNSRVALWLDYDGDARLDLLVGADCFENAAACSGLQVLTLYRQLAEGIGHSSGLFGSDNPAFCSIGTCSPQGILFRRNLKPPERGT